MLFEFDEYAPLGNGTNYDIHPDGDRFVFITDGAGPASQASSPNVVITNALNTGGRERWQRSIAC